MSNFFLHKKLYDKVEKMTATKKKDAFREHIRRLSHKILTQSARKMENRSMWL